METQPTNYDSVIYPSYTHPQTHPDWLGVVGALFGLEPAPTKRCRVLELACGNGSNLIPMAWGLPDSEFIGIDLAGTPIARGQQMIQELGMTNVRLVHGNITQISDDWGKFDYIITHGLYSWVPTDIQKQIFEICRHRLAPQGIAFISYNALPGCHLRTMLREMMLFHIRGFDSPDERVKQALALVRFLAESQSTSDEYRVWMKAELEHINEHEEGHLYHDELADLNEPLYFTQFMERAAAHGLQYLGEADFFEMSDYQFSAPARKTLEQLAPNRLLREQYLDFLKCRRFRQTLLCHREVHLQTKPLAEKVAGFVVSSSVRCANGAADLRPGVNCVFETPKGAKVETDLALGKAALVVLETIWPAPLRFDELVAQAMRRLNQEGITLEDDGASREVLREFLMRLFSAGALEFRTNLPPVARIPGERPLVHPIARWQAQRGDTVTSLFHIAVKVGDEIGRCLLIWLDGTQDRNALLEKLWSLLKSKNALVTPGGDETAARNELKLKLEKNLEKLAKMGLLTA